MRNWSTFADKRLLSRIAVQSTTFNETNKILFFKRHLYGLHSTAVPALVQKWSQEVRFGKKKSYYVRCLLPKVETKSSCASDVSPSRHQVRKLTYCHALFLLPPEISKSLRYRWRWSPGRTQIRSYCSKLTAPPPPTTEEYTEPRRCNTSDVYLFIQLPGSDSCKALWLWLQHILMHLSLWCRLGKSHSKIKQAKCFRSFNIEKIYCIFPDI